ncbi:hypothetical protein [Lysobacter arvi]|uniref:EF-hand domain-containing protein n=1 Tax=Lysobacter arvi TaxID=3038776 RepID=A0ABU1CAH9_9GAMM|nr:hypothetical protein [Lysobacter arvi]MDR0182130.1 hypothetical protein [Lysobacter arvi]
MGLNIREQASSKSVVVGLLPRGTCIEVGERSPNGKWARIAKVIDGAIDSPVAGAHVPLGAANGWVYLGELTADTRPEAFDRVVTLKVPYPVRQGDVLAYLGEDVPARANPIANQPLSRRLLHLEVFSADDVPAYLAASRQWAAAHLTDQDRTLLVLRPGDTLHVEPNGAVACTLKWTQVLPVSALEVKEVGGARWRKVSGLTLGNGQTVAGWTKEYGHLASPWEWPGFDVVDERASESGGIFDDVAAWAGFIKKEAPRPEETPFYRQLRRMLDTDKDGQISEEELDAALRDRSKAAHIARIIVRHDSEWAMEPAKRQQSAVESIAELLGFDAVQRVREEMPRAPKLPWWDEVAAGVKGFPKNPRVYHFHAGGVAGMLGEKSPENCECGCCLGAIFATVSYHGVSGPSYRGKKPLSAYGRWGALVQKGDATTDERDILVAMSENEGNLDSIQAYDSEILTAGAMQKTINSQGLGEFPGQVAAFRRRCPDRYEALFERCGWVVVSEASGARMYYKGKTGPALKQEIRSEFSTPKRGKGKSELLAALVNAISSAEFQDQQVIDFIARMHLVENIIPAGYSVRIGAYLKSKLGRAVVLDHHVNRPGYVRADFGAALDRYFSGSPTTPRNPERWGEAHAKYEAAILEIYGPARRMTDAGLRYRNLKGKL